MMISGSIRHNSFVASPTVVIGADCSQSSPNGCATTSVTARSMSKPWWQRALDRGHWVRRGFSTEYPGATAFIPAAAPNFTEMNRTAGDIDRVVIHITSGTNVGSAINTFAARTNPDRTSAHYVIARDGTVYQMVREKDRAHHAGSAANRRSIGIEHAASNRSAPTDEQYLASAFLVRYLTDKYAIPVDRTHILGHQEIVTTSHNCPGPLWDWPNYMMLIHVANVLVWTPFWSRV